MDIGGGSRGRGVSRSSLSAGSAGCVAAAMTSSSEMIEGDIEESVKSSS